MSNKNIVSLLLLLTAFSVMSQDNNFAVTEIPKELLKNANAVVRLNEVFVLLKSSSEMSIKERRVITILNKQGNKNIDAFVHYDDKVKIKTLEVLVYDAFGNKIKKIKKNDFKDVSAVDGGTLYSDSRVKYLEYTPINYPYTIEFIYEKNTSNTAFIPSFVPVDDYFVSIETSTYTINFPKGINIRKKEKTIENINVEKKELEQSIFYKAKNLSAFKPEDYSPSLIDFTPKVLFASKQFTLEGVETIVETWDDFAKWMYHDLIKNTHDLPASTVSMIQNLVKDETNDLDKAKKIYQYVQDKVRYISVQVGIGGWKPFNASEVDRLSYGDCKGLTNYTMSLLKAANIESNYSIVYAGNSQRNIEQDFTSIQGNHVILSIPNNDETVWLECTSQKVPFGFIGDFTDDRDVLVITPEGGKIEHTKKYNTEESTQIINGNYTVSNDGNINVKVKVKSKGIQYDDKYWLETETERDLDQYYKERRWDYINNLNFSEKSISNDKETIEFEESIKFTASNYASVVGNRMLLTVNTLNRNTYIPDRYRNRKLPLKIKRGFKDIDEVEITLPLDYKVESIPNKKIINNKFGSYKTEVIVKNDNTLLYKREFIVNDGEFPKEDYKLFRDFYKKVSKEDNAKIALIKKE